MENNATKIVILCFIVWFSSICFSQVGSNNNDYTQSDLYKKVKYSEVDETSVLNCFRLNKFHKGGESELWVELDPIENGYTINGGGIINENFKNSQCIFWYSDFILEIQNNQHWIFWRNQSKLGPSYIDYSPKQVKYYRPIQLNFIIRLTNSNDGPIKRQARVRFEYKPNEFVYSKPFEVSITQEQWDWILNYNQILLGNLE